MNNTDEYFKIKNSKILDILLKELKSRNINWITDEEFINVLAETYKDYKSTYPNVDEILNHIPCDLIVDTALNVYLTKIENTQKAKGIIKTFKEIQNNPILKKIKPWFKLDVLLSNLIYNDFSNDINLKYENIWKDNIKSKVDPTYKKNYIINEDGFRTSYYNENYIACFGCEKTFGLNENDEDIWPVLLSNKLQMPCENYGDINVSTDTITRYIWQYLQYKTPKAVFILFPNIKRMEYFDDNNQILNLIPEMEFGSTSFQRSYDKISITPNSLFKFFQNYLMIKITCKNKNIPFYWYTTSEVLLEIPFKFFTFGVNDIDLNNTYSDNNGLLNINLNNSLSNFEYNFKLVEMFSNLYNNGK